MRTKKSRKKRVLDFLDAYALSIALGFVAVVYIILAITPGGSQ